MGEAETRRSATEALGIDAVAEVCGAAVLPAWWDVDGLADAAVATFADALVALTGAPRARVVRERVATWFRHALTPVGWTIPSPWDAVAGDYATADGWIRLHTNAPRHRAAALRVLGVPEERERVAEAARAWPAADLESAVVEAGGAAAAMRTAAEWAVHPQGAAVAAEPLVARTPTEPGERGWRPSRDRPLAGIRVLDLTRVLAGPTATRALAAFGATVLRIDSPDWDEPAVAPDMTLGKRAARLDATTRVGRERLAALLAGADVLVHGYRRDALDGLGLDAATRHAIRPGLVEVSLTAYGWTGPWSGRRGFDSLVQMSAGIAERGMRQESAGRPVPLPVQALDHATGWLMAAAAVAGLRDRLVDGHGSIAHLSLARTAAALERAEPGPAAAPAEIPTERIPTPWGSAALAAPPLEVDGATFRFDRGPVALGSGEPAWP